MFLPIIARSDAILPLPSIPSVVASDLTTPVCGFTGNNDIYGIGIRIGIYTQIIAVWFANYFLLSEAQVLRDSVSIFSVAVLVVSLMFAADPSAVYAVEAFILLQILAWSCMMAVHAKSSYASAIHFRATMFRKVVNDTINLCMVALHVWFWWKGMDEMKKTPCGTYLMYVVKTDMFGWARLVMKIFSVFVLITTVYWVVVEYVKLWFSIRMKKTKEEMAEALKAWDESQTRQRVDTLDVRVVGPEETDTHETCSQSSCSRCFPVERRPSLDREVTLVQTSRVPTPTSSHSLHVPSSRTPISGPALDLVSPKAVSISDPTEQLNLPEYAILRQIYESELYIQHCVAASPFQISKDGKPLPPLTMLKSVLSSCKKEKKKKDKAKGNAASSPSSSSSQPTSWFQCHLHLWKAIFTLRFPTHSFAIYSHLQNARLLDPLNGPFQLNASLEYNHSTPTAMNWQSISLASSILLTRPSAPKKVWLGWYYTLIDLFVHVLVILQLELTLAWNRVDGLSELWTNIGQLIPFIIGVSGLSLVLGRWVVRRWEKRGGGRGGGILEEMDDEGEVGGLDKGVRDEYSTWKDAYTR
ncbi:hypothetical protein K504DRAFT_462345 [Pleomassaria siparia CBS 279.74]|uniref:Uncharacterized protein n=1 Tax=Pleomassaria siparia CBS 279.74 TaxID=1314801 RepID=A0A6G1KMU3_9PLEO|nr:hypothetical protein K504DRAFT_462345 [Pleomassaria siparia CBS 279.74]